MSSGNDGEQQRAEGPAAEARPRTPLLRRLRLALPLMLLALVFTAVFNRLGLLRQLETGILDTQMRLDEPEGESPVVVVEITQQDFEQLFQGQTRPLLPSALRQLIDTVARGKPCVIGVDIDTHFPQFKEFAVSKDWPPVVWVREIEDPTAEVGAQLSTLDVLGGQDQSLNSRSGLPLLIDDTVGVTRYYTRLFETTGGPVPSFAWAVYKASRDARCPGLAHPDLEEGTGPLLIRYARGREGAGRTRLPASHVMKLAGGGGWEDNALIAGKIVIIGSSYLGEDTHDTPLGRMTGVEVTANVIESELRGGGIKPPSLPTVWLLLLFEGFLLIALFQILPPRQALLFSLPLVLFLSLACSLLTYRSFSHWAFFAPVMLGVIVAELIDMLKDLYKLKIKGAYGAAGEAANDRVREAPPEGKRNLKK